MPFFLKSIKTNSCSLIRFSALVALIMSLSACGKISRSFETKQDEKNYILYVESQDVFIKGKFKELVNWFNVETCFEVLGYTYNKDESNSTIVLTKNLRQRDGKVGWGQYIINSHIDHKWYQFERPIRTNQYSMNLEFDWDYMMNSFSETKSYSLESAKVLFAHEVGHGLTMDHDENQPNSIMFPDVGGPKDFETYFIRVREFFGLPTQSCHQ